MIIAGAGIIGLSCAWRLSQAGASVTVFDAGEAAREASWAGAGMLAPGGEVDSATPLAELSLRSLAQYAEFVRELEQESGVSIDFRECGAIEVAVTEPECHDLRSRAERQEELGISSEPARHRGFEARFYPGDSLVNPRDVTEALLIACRRRGVKVAENQPVLEVLPEGAGVRTTGGELRGDAVLIAAGAWSSELFGGLPRSFPVKGHLLGYRLAPGFLRPILRSGKTYLLQRRSGLLIAGSTTEQVGFDRSVDAQMVRDIHERAARLIPALRGREPDESWVGFRPGVSPETPVIGRVEGTRVWTAFGHYRNGILLAPETARMIAASYLAA